MGGKTRTLLRAPLLEAKEYVPMKEGRALWQLTAVGVLRAPLMELGRRFVAAGALWGHNIGLQVRIAILGGLFRPRNTA